MPTPTTAGVRLPASPIEPKARIMPTTVPIMPRIGARLATVARVVRFRSR